MTNTTKGRSRGRPQGSSRYSQSDLRLLERVADMLLADRKLSPRAAIVQILKLQDTAGLRRLQAKLATRPREVWLAEADSRRIEASRLEEARRKRLAATVHAAVELPSQFAAFAEQFVDSPTVRQLRENARIMGESGLSQRMSAQIDVFQQVASQLDAFRLNPALQAFLTVCNQHDARIQTFARSQNMPFPWK